MNRVAQDTALGRTDVLVRRFQNGQTGSFDELYRRHHPRFLRFCRRATHDQREAEIIAREAFVQAFEHLDRLADRSRFYPRLTAEAARISFDRQVRSRGTAAPSSETARSWAAA